jgi:hypothetical protein
MVTIKINTDNEAFENPIEAGTELARILRKLAASFNEEPLSNGTGRVRDINGNTIGSVTVTGRSTNFKYR